MANSIKVFEVGKSYSMRSACDCECVRTYKVIKRTKSTITLKSDRGEVLRCRVKVCDIFGAECCHPLGHFSMSPFLRAIFGAECCHPLGRYSMSPILRA